jgi:hypothetical protein
MWSPKASGDDGGPNDTRRIESFASQKRFRCPVFPDAYVGQSESCNFGVGAEVTSVNTITIPSLSQFE